MFRLIRIWDAERELSPENYQYILTPREAFRQAKIYYDISSDSYHNSSRAFYHDLPRRKTGQINPFSRPDQRRQTGYSDEVYDNTERNIDMGWVIGIDTSEHWNYYRNPFFFDSESNLIYDCFMETHGQSFEGAVRNAYSGSLNNHNGRKPPPTQKQIFYGGVLEQHAQAPKTINSKAAGRLLAAGGVYNGNIEGFRQTAAQLGGEASAGYDDVVNETTSGVAIASASILAAISKGGAVGEVAQLEKLTSGAARASKFAHNWPTADLNASVSKFAGNNPIVTMTESGKRIYTHTETGIQVVEDVAGKYFRINDPSLPGKRTYLDLDGNIPNNKFLEAGQQIGRTQSEYNEVTHFNILGVE